MKDHTTVMCLVGGVASIWMGVNSAIEFPLVPVLMMVTGGVLWCLGILDTILRMTE